MSGPGRSTVTSSTPAGPGFYFMFSPPGAVPVTVRLHLRPGTVTVTGGPDTAAGVPAQRMPGTFSPLAATTFPAARIRPAAGAQDTGGSPWTPITRYPLPIVDNAAATDSSTGDIYSVGGYDGIVINSGYAYNTDTQAWSALPAMRYAREAAPVAFIGGKLYVTGGWGQDGKPVAALEAYDPATRHWSGGASVPVPLAGASVAVNHNQMYVVGGCDAHNCGYKTVQVYDPATNTWSVGAAYPTPVSWESCGTIGARIYCAGGTTGDLDTTATAAAYAYSPKANAWSRITPLPIPQWAAGYTATNGRLLVSGGVAGPTGGSDGFLTNTGNAYDPASAKWTALPNSISTSYRGGSACGFTRIGGDASAQYLALVREAEQLPGYSGCEYGKVGWLSHSKPASRCSQDKACGSG